ncbi:MULTISPECIES: hypothetical protein [unclassified Mycolicibacterium]|jgi:hypothetical protein|uniref:hypothetical protein n=1 Tax=unclassified Mycolicibacterium TaxID=2636767 RepID=UPI00224B8F00|nr:MULTISPECIES: hypothetical protein [unclassified Mycolicibacterium]MCX2712458.1 hypothetical protein [Mycolicibacterium sp. J2]MDX1874576.1 hypothetical protein [Mycolicibacterium sp. 120266]
MTTKPAPPWTESLELNFAGHTLNLPLIDVVVRAFGGPAGLSDASTDGLARAVSIACGSLISVSRQVGAPLVVSLCRGLVSVRVRIIVEGALNGDPLHDLSAHALSRAALGVAKIGYIHHHTSGDEVGLEMMVRCNFSRR